MVAYGAVGEERRDARACIITSRCGLPVLRPTAVRALLHSVDVGPERMDNWGQGSAATDT